MLMNVAGPGMVLIGKTQLFLRRIEDQETSIPGANVPLSECAKILRLP